MKLCHSKDYLETSTRADRQNASDVRFVIRLLYPSPPIYAHLPFSPLQSQSMRTTKPPFGAQSIATAVLGPVFLTIGIIGAELGKKYWTRKGK